MDTVIEAENISKLYRLGNVGTGTISHDLNRFWHTVRGKEDPYLKIGQTNDRAQKADGQYVWALKDVNFSVQKGDVLGIVGRNGAGKSTLLKILSRVTAPTSGSIKLKGRIASLLEVGTGFHPELTGRENIFQNGALLGMRRHEIVTKLDEIVSFSGVEKYIDTPVKRYSSGMYVRLAFAVAAHLEPEILIVDEVLAVGDADFQKKCIGKMKDVSNNEGRTVIFVSHNMAAVKSLCTKGILMEHGTITFTGTQDETIDRYLAGAAQSEWCVEYEYADAPGNEWVKMKRIEISPQRVDQKPIITVKSPLLLDFEFWLEQDDVPTNLSFHLYAATGECVFNIITQLPVPVLKKGLHKGTCQIPASFLNTGMFSISMMVVRNTSVPIYNWENAISFEVEEERENTNWHGRFPGFVRPDFDFKLLSK